MTPQSSRLEWGRLKSMTRAGAFELAVVLYGVNGGPWKVFNAPDMA